MHHIITAKEAVEIFDAVINEAIVVKKFIDETNRSLADMPQDDFDIRQLNNNELDLHTLLYQLPRIMSNEATILIKKHLPRLYNESFDDSQLTTAIEGIQCVLGSEFMPEVPEKCPTNVKGSELRDDHFGP